jgi:hypothetical protein
MDNRFERLVDGELTGEEYRTLLASLDDERGGWKQCALAFLQDQALAGELGAIRRRLDLREEQAAEALLQKQPPSFHSSAWRQMPMLLAMAACFLAAFALGVVAPRFFSPLLQDGQPGGNLIAETPVIGESPTGRHETFRPIGNLKLVMDGAGGEKLQAGQVPVYEVGQDLEQFLSANQPALGPEVIERMRQHGFDVQHEQQYVPASLEDGRQIIVPVDGYQITPVSRRY